MNFFGLYIFAAALILVQCEVVHQEQDEGPHNYTDVSDCAAHVREIRANRMQASLKPRETLVTLKPQPGYNFNPNIVSVKRCSGYCLGRWSPRPTRTQPKSFIVHLHHEGDSTPNKCVAVEVEEHVACKCMCSHSANDCKPSEIWIERSCRCECRDRDAQKSNCQSLNRHVWIDQDCSCVCAGKTACPAGLRWAEDVCGCVSA